MIKFVMCLRRHPDMTREQFQEYWMHQHGPFFMKHAGDLRAKKYVQSLRVDTPLNEGLRNSRGMLPAYDGVADLLMEWRYRLLDREHVPDASIFSKIKINGYLSIAVSCGN